MRAEVEDQELDLTFSSFLPPQLFAVDADGHANGDEKLVCLLESLLFPQRCRKTLEGEGTVALIHHVQLERREMDDGGI